MRRIAYFQSLKGGKEYFDGDACLGEWEWEPSSHFRPKPGHPFWGKLFRTADSRWVVVACKLDLQDNPTFADVPKEITPAEAMEFLAKFEHDIPEDLFELVESTRQIAPLPDSTPTVAAHVSFRPEVEILSPTRQSRLMAYPEANPPMVCLDERTWYIDTSPQAVLFLKRLIERNGELVSFAKFRDAHPEMGANATWKRLKKKFEPAVRNLIESSTQGIRLKIEMLSSNPTT